MSKNEKSLKIVKSALKTYDAPEQVIKHVDNLAELVKRDKPMKPKQVEKITKVDKVYTYGTCANCDEELQDYEVFCHNCGQRINW